MTLYLTDRSIRPRSPGRARPVASPRKPYPSGATTNSMLASPTSVDPPGARRDGKARPVAARARRGHRCRHRPVRSRGGVHRPCAGAALLWTSGLEGGHVEHITICEAVDFVAGAGPHLAATTAHFHLLLQPQRHFPGRHPPALFHPSRCSSSETHRQALLAAATSGNPKFFPAPTAPPHARHTKEVAQAPAARHCAVCAGTPHASFAGALDCLMRSVSCFGPASRRLRSRRTVTLESTAVRCWRPPSGKARCWCRRGRGDRSRGVRSPGTLLPGGRPDVGTPAALPVPGCRCPPRPQFRWHPRKPAIPASRPPLPARDGVDPARQPAGRRQGRNYRLSCRNAFPMTATCLGQRLGARRGRQRDGETLTTASAYRQGLRIWYSRVRAEVALPYVETVLHRDAHLLVIDMFAQAGRSCPAGRGYARRCWCACAWLGLLADAAAPARLADRRAGAASVDPATRAAYAALFPERRITETCEALAPGLAGSARCAPQPLWSLPASGWAPDVARAAGPPNTGDSAHIGPSMRCRFRRLRPAEPPAVARATAALQHTRSARLGPERSALPAAAGAGASDDPAAGRCNAAGARGCAFTDPLGGEPRAAVTAASHLGFPLLETTAMTRKLFWDDPYRSALDTVVASVDGETVRLAETIFYAFSGGQESDHGCIGVCRCSKPAGRGTTSLHAAGRTWPAGGGMPVTVDRLAAALPLADAAAPRPNWCWNSSARCPGIDRIGAHIGARTRRIDIRVGCSRRRRCCRTSTGRSSALIKPTGRSSAPAMPRTSGATGRSRDRTRSLVAARTCAAPARSASWH